MLPFFNQLNRWRITGQMLNATALLIAAYNLVQHPEDALKAAPGIAGHLLNIYALRGQDSVVLDAITSCLSLERSYLIYNTTSFDSVTCAFNLLDMSSYLLSVGILFVTNGQHDEVVSSEKNSLAPG